MILLDITRKRPLLLFYYITYRCNCRCRFCNIHKLKESPDAEIKDVVQNLRDAKKLGAKFVDFTGGEPLLHKNLPQLLYAAKELGFKTSVTTNCLLYPQKAQSIAGLVDFLHFSLDSLDQKQHDSIRGQKSFHQVLNSIDIARKLGEKPDLLCTVDHDNFSQLTPLSLFARNLGLILIINPVFSAFSGFVPQMNTMEKTNRYLFKPYVYVNPAFNNLRKAGGNDIKRARCRVVTSSLIISPDNHLFLPCFHYFTEKIAISNLLEIRQSSIWKQMENQQGQFAFCKGCVINCYFDPSFLYKRDQFFWASVLSKMLYVVNKNIRRKFDQILNNKTAFQIAERIHLGT